MKLGWWVLLGALAAAVPAEGQSLRSLVNGGNDLYREQKFTEAEVNYRKALEREKDLVQGHFNLGNALAKQGKHEEAAREFDLAAQTARQSETRAYAHYNIGNTQMAEGRYEDAVRSYVDALKLHPGDDETKYNLSYALQKLREQIGRCLPQNLANAPGSHHQVSVVLEKQDFVHSV